MFRSKFAEDIFHQKYAHEGCETWEDLACTLVEDVCEGCLTKDEMSQLAQYIIDLKFIPGGRYLYYAGRERKFFNNCYLLKAEEDNREDWAELSWKSELCLSTGGGIGVDYSIYRSSGNILHGTGGTASGPLAKMEMVNAQGRGIMQGGSRRSAIYASLDSDHGDIEEFLRMKNWYEMPVPGTDMSIGQLKEIPDNFNLHAPMDMTNISVNYKTPWLLNYWETGDYGQTFERNCYQALSTGEPGFSFNFFGKENETLRNACTEVTSEDDSDVCNLGSINLGRINNILELADITRLGTAFLICGTLKADLPYPKVRVVREKNRRLGLGIMGLHEWLVKKGYKYETRSELKRWLSVFEAASGDAARSYSKSLSISEPIAVRAIAPTGSIGILAGTTTGIEPIFAVAYKRRYLKGKVWKYQYVVDSAAQELIDLYGVNPNDLESALHLAADYERRIQLQAEVQEFIDQGISSTINLPPWGSELNNPDIVSEFARVLAKHSHRLRGFTCYPDGSRGGQPLVEVPYKEAVEKLGEEFEENIQTHDVCVIGGKSGVCGT